MIAAHTADGIITHNLDLVSHDPTDPRQEEPERNQGDNQGGLRSDVSCEYRDRVMLTTPRIIREQTVLIRIP